MNASDLPDETLFEGALKCRTPAERAAYLDQACAGQPQLRQQLEALLAAHDQSGEFLEPPASARPTIKLDFASEEKAGTMIGRYKLLQKIGEGGMGVVYMAEQTEPVVRKVALKIIKLGMDTKAVVARFEAERQALALMDHPNIAKVLDAGTTGAPVAAGILPAVEPGFQPGGKGNGGFCSIDQSEAAARARTSPGGKMPPSTAGRMPAATLTAGRPYFVMELVHGVPITEYCDKNKLTTQERLELFIPVCQAIQHAHQKGIIHRDIKPSNVMVTLHDGVPVPKVIDFGVAKATNQRLTEKTLFTHYAQMIGTPAYMSPEQAEMSGLDIDTRSDIYSLGVLLYELLTGTTPFDAKELLSKGYAEMQRIIAEQEPAKPSTRMSTLTDEQRTVVATQRSTELSALRKVLQGDLDWIVMKCLEKDRTRRYETSNGLAADLRRHLSNELISARPPTTAYLLKKLIRRNKVAFATTAIVAASLLIGIVATAWQTVRARKAERQALATVEELRETAPAFVEQARALVALSKFDEAIAKLDYAIKLRPGVAGYLVFKANLLQCQFKLAEAAEIYRIVLKAKPDEPRAKANLKLTEGLIASQSANQGRLPTQELAELMSVMQTEQRTAAELLPVSQALGKEKDNLVAYWLDRLKDLSIAADKPLRERLSLNKSGRLELDLTDTSISDLTPLTDMPLNLLNLNDCHAVTNLTPLQGMPLRTLSLKNTQVHELAPLASATNLAWLCLENTPVSDLSPLRGSHLHILHLDGCEHVTDLTPLVGMPLTELRLRSTRVASLAPLRGMPLRMLDVTFLPARDFEELSGAPIKILFLQDVRVTDLAFLKGMPLEKLSVWNSKDARNYQVLSQIKTLEILLLPENILSLPEVELVAIDALRHHPALRQIANQIGSGFGLEVVAGEKDLFWRKWDADRAIAQGRYADARPMLASTLEETRKFKRDLHPSTLEATRRLAECEAYLGNFRAAAVLLRTGLDAQVRINGPAGQPSEVGHWLSLAAVLLAARDAAGYQKVCAETLDRFGNVTDSAANAESMLKLWSLAPSSGVDDALLQSFSQKARFGEQNWYLTSAGLMEYRAGRLDEAQELLSGNITWRYSVTYRDLVLAMIHRKKGKIPEARKLLEEIRESGLAAWPPLPNEVRGDFWDLLLMHVLFEEASQLLEGPATTGATKPPKN